MKNLLVGVLALLVSAGIIWIVLMFPIILAIFVVGVLAYSIGCGITGDTGDGDNSW